MHQPLNIMETPNIIWITWERQRRSIELAKAIGATLFVFTKISFPIASPLLRYIDHSLKSIIVFAKYKQIGRAHV